jgi:ATP-dependent DNA helicase 2 subunit 2
MGEVQYIYADVGSSRAQVAFSSIVHAMFKQGLMALVRWVNRDDSDPKMGVCKAEPGEVDYMMWVQVSTDAADMWSSLTMYAPSTFRSHSRKISGTTAFLHWNDMSQKKAKY